MGKHKGRISIWTPFLNLLKERYQLKLHKCSFYLNEALEIAQPDEILIFIFGHGNILIVFQHQQAPIGVFCGYHYKKFILLSS
jgi:hypothetical protein